MKTKLLVFLLTLFMIFSTSGIVFAEGDLANPPERPQVESYQDNDKIEEYNQQVDEYNAQVTEYNNKVDQDYETDCAQYEEEKVIVEANNTFVENVENKIETDTSEARGFENSTTSSDSVPTDWSDNESQELKTIEIEKSDNPTGKTIKVINLHVYLKENSNLTYNDLDPTFYNTLESQTFELSDSLKNNAVLTEWEIAEIDYDDTVTVLSEAVTFAGNIVWLNGKRSWFGANPNPYFLRSLEGYTQGYWTPGGSMIATTATEQESSWSLGGETYSIHHAEETATSHYSYNGQMMTEEITVRTTDKQEPKNIFALFTYIFNRLTAEPEKQELPEEPVKGEYLSYLDKLDLFEVPTLENPTETNPTLVDPTEQNPTKVEPTKTNFTPETIIYGRGDSLEAIYDNEVPKAKSKTEKEEEEEKYWALLNLIIVILTILLCLIFILKKKDDELEDSDKRKVNIGKIISFLISIISIIIFILTEDMSLPMQWIDNWTLLMMIIFLGESGIDYYIYKKSQADNEDE